MGFSWGRNRDTLYIDGCVPKNIYLCGEANDTACRSGTSAAGLLALLSPALAEIISTSMGDDGAL